MKSDFLMDLSQKTPFAERIGGARFGQASGSYKFERIKQAQRAFEQQHPEIPLLNFGIGEPQTPPPENVIHTLYKAATKPENHGYSDCGILPFCDAARKYMKKVFQVDLSPEEILPSMGIKSALTQTALAFLNPGDVLLMPTPAYPVLATHASYLGAEIHSLPLKQENHFLPVLETIPEDILRRAKMLYLNYPNNPTGACATKEFFEKAIQLAKKYHFVIVQDAAYSGLWDDESPASSILQLPQAKEVAIELHSCSKGHRMTGWRIGWICGNHQLVAAYRKIKDNSDSGQFKPIQFAAIEALQDLSIPQKSMAEYRNKYEAVAKVLKEFGFTSPENSHPFYLYVSAPKGVLSSNGNIQFSDAATATEWLLTQCGILTVPWDEVTPEIRFSMTIPLSVNEIQCALLERLKGLQLYF